MGRDADTMSFKRRLAKPVQGTNMEDPVAGQLNPEEDWLVLR